MDTVSWNFPRPPNSSPSRVTSFGKSTSNRKNLSFPTNGGCMRTFKEPFWGCKGVAESAQETLAVKVGSVAGHHQYARAGTNARTIMHRTPSNFSDIHHPVGSWLASSHLTARSNCGTFFFKAPPSLASPSLSSASSPSSTFDAGLDWRVFLLRGFSSSSSCSPRFRLLFDAGFFAPEGPAAASGFASFRRAAS